MWGVSTLIWRVLAVLYPSVLALIVIATGNHFRLDLAGGAACVLVAHAVVTWIGARYGSPRAAPA